MKIVLALSLLIMASLSYAQQLSPSAFSAIELTKVLKPKTKASRYPDYATALYSAESALSLSKYPKAAFAFEQAKILGIPDARWYLGMSYLHQQQGLDSLSLDFLEKGLEMYPFAEQLNLAYAKRTNADNQEGINFKASALTQAQLKALLAFKEEGDILKGMLETERAHYLGLDQSLDPELRALFFDHISQAYIQSSALTENDSNPLNANYAKGSAQEAYLAAYQQAVNLWNSSNDLKEKDQISYLKGLAEIRTITIRKFAEKGHLAKSTDPLMLKLYVLAQKGHLTGATLYLFKRRMDSKTLGIVDGLSRYTTEITAALEYMQDYWSEDFNALLYQRKKLKN